MVPEGWEHKSLEAVSNIIDCKHRTPKYVESGVPLVSPGSIKWGPIDLISPTKRVSYEEYESLMDHCTVDVGDLVLSRNQSVGVASFIDTNRPFVLGQDTVLIKPIDIDSKFLFYDLQSTETQRMIFKLAGGSTFSRINLGDIRKLKGIYPPLHEQKKIAQILSTWDKAIITTEKLLANSEQQKKALMQQLLTGRRRFPGFSEKWENVRLGNVADMNSGGTPKSSKAEYYEGDIPWVSIADMTQHGKYIVKTKRNITLLGLKNSSAKLYPENTVLYAMYASIGECSIAKIKLTSSQAILGIRPKSELNNFYLYFYLSSLKNKIKLQGQQGTQSNLNAEMVKNFRFKLPLLHEQTKIVAMLTVSDQEIETLQQKLRYLKQEKKALMQQLLTGKRRVK